MVEHKGHPGGERELIHVDLFYYSLLPTHPPFPTLKSGPDRPGHPSPAPGPWNGVRPLVSVMLRSRQPCGSKTAAKMCDPDQSAQLVCSENIRIDELSWEPRRHYWAYPASSSNGIRSVIHRTWCVHGYVIVYVMYLDSTTATLEFVEA
ncbi:hypothetical protein LZ31DRAFT_180210 [Colletotrichum somersetense]|nr:hypothetical protein LZ31DRAFT_180210 [Colletotrichum somersetense]